MRQLIFIDNKVHFDSIEPELRMLFELFWFPAINDFHLGLIDKSSIAAVIICESNPHYIGGTRNNLILARHYGYRLPVVLLSFLPNGYLTEIKDYNLQGFTQDKSHLYLQLPFENAELISAIEAARPVPEDVSPADLTFVRDSKVLIEHIVDRHVTSMAISPDYKGKGLTKQLFERFRLTSAKNGFEMQCLVAVQNSAEFWGKLGFERIFEVIDSGYLNEFYMKRTSNLFFNSI